MNADDRLRQLDRHCTDTWDSTGGGERSPHAGHAGIAVLRYTSGSTGQPRGVVVTHSNLLDNQRQIEVSFGHSSDSVILSWLPMFHDMGLGTVLQALWIGVPCVLMSPSAFLQQPVRWLRAITKYRATTSGGPILATISVREKFQLRGTRPQRVERRLHGRRAGSGRHAAAFRGDIFGVRLPIRSVSSSVQVWRRRRSSSAARRPAPRPCSRRFLRRRWQRALERQSFGTLLVGCGRAWIDSKIVIADPETRAELPSGGLVKSASRAQCRLGVLEPARGNGGDVPAATADGRSRFR